MTAKPRVLFVCVRNAGKSHMAAGLMRHMAGDAVEVSSAGTAPGAALNDLSVRALQEIGVDITDEHPKAVTDDMLRSADIVVALGRETHVDAVEGVGSVTWITDEPSERGIDGMERMRLIRDDIAARVYALTGELGVPSDQAQLPGTQG